MPVCVCVGGGGGVGVCVWGGGSSCVCVCVCMCVCVCACVCVGGCRRGHIVLAVFPLGTRITFNLPLGASLLIRAHEQSD